VRTSIVAVPLLAALAALPGTAASPGDPVAGKRLFATTCAGCHPAGGNAIVPDAPLKGAVFARKFADDARIVAVVRNGIKGTAMPPFSVKAVSDADLKSMIAYLRTLTPRGK